MHDGGGKQLEEQRHQQRVDSGDEKSVFQTVFDAVKVSCAVILAGEGGQRGADGAVGLVQQAFDAVGGGVGSHHICAFKGIDEGLKRGGGDGDERPLEGHGQSDLHCLADEQTIRLQIFA